MPQKKLTSKAFKAQKRVSGKEFRDGVVGEALDDLYADVDAGFNALEQDTIAALDNGADIDAVRTQVQAVLVALKAAGIIADA